MTAEYEFTEKEESHGAGTLRPAAVQLEGTTEDGRQEVTTSTFGPSTAQRQHEASRSSTDPLAEPAGIPRR